MTEPVQPAVDQGPPSNSSMPMRRSARGARAREWWLTRCHPDRDAGTRAQLRRARSPIDALQIIAAVELARRIGAVPKDGQAPDWLVRSALDLARVLAHVRQDDPSQHPMRAAGWKTFPGDRKESEAGEARPRLSGARFKRLIETGDGEEKVSAFVRLVALLDGKVNVERLAADFLLWNHPEHGDRVRERWAFLYLAAGSAAPQLPSFNDEETDA